MNWRGVTEGDLDECLALDLSHIGDELIGRERSLGAWRKLIRDPSFGSCVIERETPGRKEIVSFGACAFVSAAFAASELAEPRPGLNARILQSVESCSSVVLTESERRAGNTRGDLTIAVLSASWRRGSLSAEELREMQLLHTTSFVEMHAGYRLERLMYETTCAPDRQYAEAIPGWEMVSDFEAYYRQNPDGMWKPGRGLAVMERDTARSIPGSVGAILFQWREPVLGLRDPDQHLLLAALKGLTDDDLEKELQLSKPAIKKRWAAIFQRVAQARPDLIEEENRNGGRGRQKRHRLIAYVRKHPEELRPIELSRRAAPRTRRACP